MTSSERIVRLARRQDGAGPVVSVYLNTRWDDEHQRERTRLFVKAELRRAREGGPPQGLGQALDWVEAQTEALVAQAALADAHGIALFAGPDLGLREVVRIRAPFENAFVIADRPALRPLAAAIAEAPPALVAFVDAESARLIPVLLAGRAEEVRLDSEVPVHPRRGGWAQIAQSRYRRHIEAQRGRHLDAVAEALDRLVHEHGVERIVIAGSVDGTAAFRRCLTPTTAGRVVGAVPGQRQEPASALVERAIAEIDRAATAEAEAAVDGVLTDAAKGTRAVAGLEGVLEAAQQGAVDGLYLLRDFREPGRACGACGALQPGAAVACRRCQGDTRAVELGEALVIRTIGAGGTLRVLDAHAGLGAIGGVAARLRFVPGG